MGDPTRRDFLRAAMHGVGAAVLTACGGQLTDIFPQPRFDPDDDPVSKLDTRWPIKRVVYVMLENRSFDHMFGRFPGANGTTVGVTEGRERPLLRAPEWLPGDLPHDYLATERHLNGGQMDGFGSNPGSVMGRVGDYFAYTQHWPDTLPNYWRWARNFVLSDNFFASAIGNSYPQHLFYIAGTSAGAYTAPQEVKIREVAGVRYKSWGCDGDPDQYILVRDADGAERRVPGCLDLPTVGDQLRREGVDWAYYSPEWYQVGYIWNAYAAIERYIHDPELWRRHIRSVDDLVGDARDANLPAVTWAVPRFELSDHPPWSTCHTHNWVTSLVNGIMRSPVWRHTAIFITWDEWGGFYDHVPPPQIDNIGLGIRVPMLVISPYAKQGYVDHALGDFTSPLRFISDNWGLPYLTDRIRKTHNFEHVFDFRQRPRDPDPLPIKRDCEGEPWIPWRDIEDWPPRFLNPRFAPPR